MEHSVDVEKWRYHIQPFLQSKLEEFYILGLNSMTMDELWTFILESLEKKKQHPQHLHQFVNFVMTLSVNDYMNRIRMQMFQSSDLAEDDSLLK
ncbi:post-transcriptional regulator [Tuberibacillus sp. Marseille-P3662]|uniref:post-transcriptional regulator n=1 Tax=Tuberibacillus sp. Marseille-P3662 TaxID=1965358 RepID=UPI000A1CB684|nr:post-transcriptional regulator [Tuberibacillus sp. Marseille-P3662]